MTHRFRPLLALLLAHVAMLLAACASDAPEPPERPGEDDESATYAPFTVSAAQPESVAEGRAADTFAITFMAQDGSSLSMRLPAAKMSTPSGRFPARGAILRRGHAPAIEVSGGDIELSRGAETSYSIQGELSLGQRAVSVSGTCALPLRPCPMAVQLDQVASATASPAGLALILANDDDWELHFTAFGAEDIWDVTASTPVTSAALHDRREDIEYPLAGPLAINASMGILAGSYDDALLRVSFGAWIGTRPGTPNPEPDPEPDPEQPLPDGALRLVSLLHAEKPAAGTLRLYLGDGSASLNYDPKQWQITYSGTGRILVLELHTIDGALPPGLYPASATATPGTFRIGYDPGDIHGIGLYLRDWGTCLLTVTDGRAQAAHVTDGAVRVTSEGLTLVSTTLTAHYPGPLP